MKCFKDALELVRKSPPWLSERQKSSYSWNPYSFEGGSTAAVAGENFAVIASDTRMSQFEINILTRKAEKISVLNDSIILACAGFYGDILQLRRVLQARLHKYRFDYRGDMTVDLCAELLSRNLYYRRFFPYYTGAILAGIDENGNGAVFSYDPIGCVQRVTYTASGSAEPLIIPFFDCQINQVTQSDETERIPLTVERATSLMKDAFRMVAEREIGTGDRIHLVIAECNKPIRQVYLPLRED
ncbi:unnamed protein product [Enterobius vermicularis]|uniref:Proteasome subunit beta n=1 Tax=Enterobius vermicularis TaxID=51028 RepID=A0A0N4V6P9_ENTVE|nr:unnamed protein product [Enterobius vermicularis]